MPSTKGLLSRLQEGEAVVCAEGYLFELEQRGYLSAGPFVPEVVLDNPDVVRMLHEEFVHAGSDVVLAFTYYGHRPGMKVVGREHDLEHLNRRALQLARTVADKTGTLMAGNISNTNLYRPNNQEVMETIEAIFKEQIEWAVEEEADFIVAETIGFAEEAYLALECIKKYGNGLPAVVTLDPMENINSASTAPAAAMCKKLEENGAAVVGMNCGMGPATIIPSMKAVRQACKGPIACIPVPYRTTDEHPCMQALMDPTGIKAMPGNLNPWQCSRIDIANFTKEARELGVQYLGLCCGNQAHYIRTMAETLGRQPPASKYSPNYSLHVSEIKDAEFSVAQKNYRQRKQY